MRDPMFIVDQIKFTVSGNDNFITESDIAVDRLL